MPAEDDRGEIRRLPFEKSDPQISLRFVERMETIPNHTPTAANSVTSTGRMLRILQQLWVTTRYEQVEDKIRSRMVGTEWRDVPLEVE